MAMAADLLASPPEREVNPATGRRCTAIGAKGTQCRAWAEKGSDECSYHARGLIVGNLYRPGEMANAEVTFDEKEVLARSPYQFKSPILQKQFLAHFYNPDKMCLDAELALIRTCLQGVVAKIKADAAEDLGPDAIALLTTLAKNVAECVETMSRVQERLDTSVQVEQLMIAVEGFASLAREFIPEEDFAVFAQKLRDVPLMSMSWRQIHFAQADAAAPDLVPQYQVARRRLQEKINERKRISRARKLGLPGPASAAVADEVLQEIDAAELAAANARSEKVEAVETNVTQVQQGALNDA